MSTEDWLQWMVENRVELIPVLEKSNRKGTRIGKWLAGRRQLDSVNNWRNAVLSGNQVVGKTPLEVLEGLKEILSKKEVEDLF